MAPGIPSIANLRVPSKPEEKIPTDSLPEMDLEDLLHLELAALGRTTSKKSPLKPEEELAEDPMPENEPLTKPLPEWPLEKEYFRQPSKQTPRPSYYTYELPEGLPADGAASPNRLLHEEGQSSIVQFLESIENSPKTLKKEIYARRNEEEPSDVPPLTKLELGEFFYQVGHTCPRSLVVKFAKYEKRGASFIVNPLQRSKVNEGDYDIAFTQEYFDDIRSGAPQKGDVLMRTLVVLSEPNWAVEKEGVVRYLRPCPSGRRGRLRSDSHLSVEESCDDESSTSDRSTEPHSPTENNDFSSLRDDAFRRLNSSNPEK